MSTAAPPLPSNTPPHSLQAEQAVLGAVLLSDKCLPGLRLQEGLVAAHFYRDRHRLIFEAMCVLADRGAHVDVLTVTAELDQAGTLEAVGGRAAIDELTGGVPGLGGVRRYAQIVTEHWRRREQLSAAYEQATGILNHDDELYQAGLQRAHAVVAHGVADGFLGKDRLADHMLSWLREQPDEGLPMPAELRSLANMVNLRPGHMTLVAAWPSGGKTALSLALAAATGSAGHRTVIWSNEDTAEALTAKHINAVTGIPASRIEKRDLRDDDWPAILTELGRLPFEVQPCADWDARQVAAHIQQVRPAVAVVDHFHNLARIGTVAEVDEAIRLLAAAALQTGTHLILCAQLNRNRMSGVCKPPPVAADLRGSGMFLAACHTMLLVHRDEEELADGSGSKLGQAVQLETGSVNVAKNKVTGRTGVVRLVFVSRQLRFIEAAKDEPPVVPGSPDDFGF